MRRLTPASARPRLIAHVSQMTGVVASQATISPQRLQACSVRSHGVVAGRSLPTQLDVSTPPVDEGAFDAGATDSTDVLGFAAAILACHVGLPSHWSFASRM